MKQPRVEHYNEPPIEEVLFLRYGTREPKEDVKALLSYDTLSKLFGFTKIRLWYRVKTHFSEKV